MRHFRRQPPPHRATSSSSSPTTTATTRWVSWGTRSSRRRIWMRWRATACISETRSSPRRSARRAGPRFSPASTRIATGSSTTTTRSRRARCSFRSTCSRRGYETAFIGKWHMGGESDAPAARASTTGSASAARAPICRATSGLNVNGERVPQKGYITDELTDYAIDWLEQRGQGQAVLSAISRTRPCTRISSRQSGTTAATQDSAVHAAADDGRRAGRLRRQARCGCTTSATAGTASIFRITATSTSPTTTSRYAETLLAVDDSVGRVIGLPAASKACSTRR